MIKNWSKVEKVTEPQYDEIYNLYQTVKQSVTLNGKRAIISGLSNRFPIVCADGLEVEYSHQAIIRILNKDCKFKS